MTNLSAHAAERDQGPGPAYRVPAVERAILILRTLATAADGFPLTDLATTLNLPKSTAHAILSTLNLHHFTERDPGGKWRLGLATFEIGSAYADRVDFISAFRSVAARLVAECGQTIQLGVLDDREVVYVAKVDGTEPVRLVSHDGARLPAHTTALGKALLASLPPDDFERLYRRRTLTPRTRYSIVGVETLRAEVDAIRGQGFACDHEETALGLYCVAACVMGRDGKAVAAVSISIPGHRMREDRFAEMADRVRRTASAISASLGYAGVRTQSANGS